METTSSKERGTRLEIILPKDFYWSFYHSQGNTRLQKYLFLYLARRYQKQFSTEEILDTLKLKFAGNLRIPTPHKESSRRQNLRDINVQRTNFRDFWYNYYCLAQSTLHKIYDPIELRNKFQLQKRESEEMSEILQITDKELLYEIFFGIIQRDIHYVIEGRPGRENEDIHESFLRSYSLLGRQPQTDTFQELYQDLKGVINGSLEGKDNNSLASYFPISEEVGIYLQLLSKKWEEAHPNEKFS